MNAWIEHKTKYIEQLDKEIPIISDLSSSFAESSEDADGSMADADDDDNSEPPVKVPLK